MSTTATKLHNSKGGSLVLPGASRLVRKTADGGVAIYWYLGREPGSPRIGLFKAKTLAAAEELERAGAAEVAGLYASALTARAPSGSVAELIDDYRARALPRLALSTQRIWRGHLAAIRDVFGETSVDGIQRKGVRGIIKKWHEGMSAQPRTANYRLGVLNRVLSWGVDEERLSRNPAAGIERLSEGPGRAAIVWDDWELLALVASCPPHVARVVYLAALSGLRLGDVVALNWSDVQVDAIVRDTNKSGGTQTAAIPIYPALRFALSLFPRVGPKVVTNIRKRPWKSGDSFDSSLRPALNACGVDKHFHDLRGTAATRMFRAGLSVRQIALAMGWSERDAEKIIRVYVDMAGMAEALAAQTPVVRLT